MMKNNPWKDLTKTVNTKRCDPANKFDFYWGINQNGEYLFLIEHQNFEDWSAKQLSFSEINIEHYQLKSGYRVLLTLKNLNDWDIFYTLCNDLLTLSLEVDTEKTLLTMIHNRLQRWQKMFRKTGKKILTEQEQQGLIGELIFIKNYLFKLYSSQTALLFWKGPLGEQQDFGIGNTSIEIKTKLGTSSSNIQISSIEQLDFRTKYAFLFVLTLTCSSLESDSFTLNSLINDIKQQIEDYDSLELFESLLLELGYIELPEYSEKQYIINKESFYEVKNDFPRLTISNIPNGINSIQYSIDLKSCSNYLIDNNSFTKRILDDRPA